MSFTVTGSPITAFVDAVQAALVGDSALMALVTGVFGHVSEAARVAYPYLVLGRRSRQNDSGAMQLPGGHISMQLDVFSDAKGPFPAQAILSRVAVVLERQNPTIAGFDMVRGSLTCEFEEVFDEPDEDKPGSRLYHGVQRWTADIHEVS